MEGYWMVINTEELYGMALGIFLRIINRRISCVFFLKCFLLSIIVNQQYIIMWDYMMLFLFPNHFKQFLSIAWKLHLGSCPWKNGGTGRLLSYWKGIFSGAILNLGGVDGRCLVPCSSSFLRRQEPSLPQSRAASHSKEKALVMWNIDLTCL